MEMKLNEKEIFNIIHNNVTENLICRSLEIRPGELSKYICGLANKEGGYILIGVENDNGILKAIGFQLAFDMKNVMDSVYRKLDGFHLSVYGYSNVSEKTIFVIKVEKSEQDIYVDSTYYFYQNNSVVAKTLSNVSSTLFISYAECDTPIVDIIESKLHEKLKDKIKISRYTTLKYKDSFKTFMDTIQDHDFVLTVVSDTYLKSQACMYEVGEIIKDHHYKNKLLFIVLSEKDRKYYGDKAPEMIEANVYGKATSRLEYTLLWKKRYNELNEKMNQIGDFEATKDTAIDLQIINQIYRKGIGEFLQFLSDENGRNFQQLYENEFKEIVAWILNNQ